MNKDVFSIAIDGPSGAGKSTIAKETAKRLGIIYVDTGAMYRAMGLKTIRAGINADDVESVCSILDGTDVTIEFRDGVQHVLLDNEDVSDVIRTQEVSNAASKVSAIPQVREKMVQLQRKIAEDKTVVMDGRDIGTNVLPGARFKFFVTASPEQRASRRYRELKQNGKLNGMTFNELLIEMIQRDERDSKRECNPLKKAADAILIDTTYMNIEQATAALLNKVVD